MKYIEIIEKYNPYHSTANGRFTSATGGGGGGVLATPGGLNQQFGKPEPMGSTPFSRKAIAGKSERIVEYNNHTIQFEKPVQTKDGKSWFPVKVWENDGPKMSVKFKMKNPVASDGEAMNMAIKWAKQNIDASASK